VSESSIPFGGHRLARWAVATYKSFRMSWIAIKMLLGDRGKYVGIICGVSFATLLMAQQAAIFCGLMLRTGAQIRDIQGADIWVMDPNIQFVDDVKPLSENDVYRVRGVPGVKWAVRLYKGLSRARLQDGTFQQAILIGVDDGTLVGAPRVMETGKLADLFQPDAVIIDDAGVQMLWPGERGRVGMSFEMNDRRAVLVGICASSRTFQTFPIVYTRFNQAMTYVPPERKVVSFVLTQGADGIPPREVCRRIEAQTGLKALTRQDFARMTIMYFITKTGIPFNFGITVLLGFIVGTAITAQTFYLFTLENLKQFGTLKAMGATNLRIVGMIVLQAAMVGVIGFGLGIGAAAIFGELSKGASKLAFYMPWEVMAITAGLVAFMLVLSSVFSVRRVLVLEPAIVFQGVNA